MVSHYAHAPENVVGIKHIPLRELINKEDFWFNNQKKITQVLPSVFHKFISCVKYFKT